ncbi:hypothetical protein LC605_07480 [Nostoc sp. CHAB 5836]|uniref:hypothetical protein n=1 Tax=Nostoc sp. CHAB 5836 TaxID=2780404 RepID=UPI001E4FD4EA|nr:hypothetical protein [Nostoc sp. CHAB 5836]MCC5614917.1 hypothetical protein [Nostoc sp. CHAB 5836]
MGHPFWCDRTRVRQLLETLRVACLRAGVRSGQVGIGHKRQRAKTYSNLSPAPSSPGW